MKRFWFITDGENLLGYELGHTGAEAVSAYLRWHRVPEGTQLCAMEEERVRAIEVPGYTADLLVRGPRSVHEWRPFLKAAWGLWRQGVRLRDVQKWLRVDEGLDLWVPVLRKR